MGNRLTLPLLLLATLLAGGAFFWMTGGERRAGPAARGAAERVEPSAEGPAAELAAPEITSGDDAAKVPAARTELAQVQEEQTAPRAKGHDVAVLGTVVDRFGTPVAGARVVAAADNGFPLDLELERELDSMKRHRAVTDAEGRFRLEGVEAGTLQLGVRAKGFAPHEQRGVAVPRADTELAPVTLARGAILSGQVVDPDGRGVPGARIVHEALDASPGFFLLGAREPSAVTDADGRFRIDELACGAWRFVVRSEDHPDLDVEGIAEEPGVEQAGLRWQLAPGATIAGTVTGVPPGERGELEVRAMRGPNGVGFLGLGAGRVAKVEASGAFLLRGLVVGEAYTLQARRAQPEGELGFWQRSRSNDVQARAGDSGVVLAYRPEAALLFTVLDSTTRAPLETFEVESGIDWTTPLSGDDGRARTRFPGGVVRVGGLRPSSDQDRVRLVVRAAGYRDYERADIAVRAGQELDLGPIHLDPVPVVRVRVTDQRTGAPIAGAAVRIEKQQPDGVFSARRRISVAAHEGHDEIEFGEGRSARTDEQGWAVVTSFEGESVDLSARAEGYAPSKLTGLALPSGESVEHRIALTLGGAVVVRVLDPDGVPLPGARVEHRAGEDPPGGVLTMGGLRTPGEVTDAEGKVAFENLAAGMHSFRLGDERGGGAAFAGADRLVIAGIGGGDDEDWSRVQVAEGERLEVTLRAAPRAELRGRVREGDRVLAGAMLRLTKERPAGEEPPPMLPGMNAGVEARSDGEGRYLIGDVKAGRYTLTVEHPTRRMPQEFVIDLREGENTFDVDLVLTILSGRIVDHEGKPLAGLRVWPERQEPAGAEQRVRVRMLMIDGDGGGGLVDSGQFGERALTDAEGRYTLRGVQSDVDLVVKAEGGTVQPGQSEVLRLSPNEVKENVDLVLQPAGSIRVEATQADGSPARFLLVQADYLDESDPPLQPRFDFLQQGSIELEGLRPGRWRVNVRNPQGGPQSGDPGQSQELEVRPKETATATFEVE